MNLQFITKEQHHNLYAFPLCANRIVGVHVHIQALVIISCRSSSTELVKLWRHILVLLLLYAFLSLTSLIVTVMLLIVTCAQLLYFADLGVGFC